MFDQQTGAGVGYMELCQISLLGSSLSIIVQWPEMFVRNGEC